MKNEIHSIQYDEIKILFIIHNPENLNLMQLSLKKQVIFYL
jgi:hypothetical protein